MSEKYQPDPTGFIAMLQDTCGGLFEEEVDRELKRLVCKARELGSTAVIGVEFTLKCTTAHEDVFDVKHQLKVGEPKKSRDSERRFGDKEGGLVTEDPQQDDMFSRRQKKQDKDPAKDPKKH